MKFSKTWAAAIVALSGAAQAALIDRGGGLIFDSTSNITWLADMNYAKTQHANSEGTQGDADGLMAWDAAYLWADNLVYGGYSDWRLPTLNPSDTTCSGGSGRGYNCTGGELSHLFVTDLGYNNNGLGVIRSDDTPEQIRNLTLFKNVQPYYWSGTEFEPNPRLAWLATTSGGDVGVDNKGIPLYAVAVRPGDVAAPVPEPQTLALVLLALGATVVARRRRPD
jgi:hypothetical protein